MGITINRHRIKLFIGLLKHNINETNLLNAIYYGCRSGRYFFISKNKF